MSGCEYVSAVCWDNVGGRNRVVSLLNKGEPFQLDEDGRMFLYPFVSIKHPFIVNRAVMFCDLRIIGGNFGVREELVNRESVINNMGLRVGFAHRFDLIAGTQEVIRQTIDTFVKISAEAKMPHVSAVTVIQHSFDKFTLKFEQGEPLAVCDAVWVARWLLRQACNQTGAELTSSSKNLGEDSLSVYVDSKLTRDMGGIGTLDLYMKQLLDNPANSAFPYRRALADGVTIPLTSEKLGKGHLIDHRPKCDSDPYQVVTFIVDRIKGSSSI